MEWTLKGGPGGMWKTEERVSPAEGRERTKAWRWGHAPQAGVTARRPRGPEWNEPQKRETEMTGARGQ